MKVTYLGHAACYVETVQSKILIDPFLTGNPLATASPDQFTPDFIFLTHGHQDHVGDTVSIGRRCGARVVAIVELADLLQQEGLDTIGACHGGWVQLPFGRIKFTPAFHTSSYQKPDGATVYAGAPAGILLEADGKSVFHLGDTALFSDLRLVGESRPVDLALVPIGEHYTMGPQDAARAVEFLRPRQVVPIHYGTFPPLIGDPNEFKRLVAGSEVLILSPGAEVEI